METRRWMKPGRHENNVFTNSSILFPLATVSNWSLAKTLRIHRYTQCMHKQGAETQEQYT